jgi:hypothetical protein
VSVEGRPVHRDIACAARPGGVSAAVSEARLMADEQPAGAEGVTIRAPRRRVDDRLPGRGLHQLAQHGNHRMTQRRHLFTAVSKKGAARGVTVVA